MDSNESARVSDVETYKIEVETFFFTTVAATSAREACALAVKYVLQSHEAGEFLEGTTKVDVVAYISDPNISCCVTVDFVKGTFK